MKRALLMLGAAALALSACGPKPIDPRRQIGPNPYLPPIHQYLLPPMHLAKKAEWGGAMPAVAAGLKIQALARNLKNPRSIYVLPNGDILVVQPDGPQAPAPARPKDYVMGWMEAKTHSSTKAPNNILLFRTNGDGAPELSTVFIDHLRAPFGVVLVGNDLYVADTDAILRFPYRTGETQIAAPGVKLCDLPAFPIDHHWTKSLTASPDGTKLYAGVGSNSNITENGLTAEVGRAAIWEIDLATGAHS
jgi:glucose/arabinose dehydrogenase